MVDNNLKMSGLYRNGHIYRVVLEEGEVMFLDEELAVDHAKKVHAVVVRDPIYLDFREGKNET